ncbi:MAG: CrcB family protein, partial [Halobacteria archaeon]|nr:CrcB family protein [Halobacteria archaeon]
MVEGKLRRAETLAMVGVGGFAGSNLRYLVGTVTPSLLGTLAANVAGSFVLGFLLYESIHLGAISKQGRFLMATGFISSFTTYSTFALETFSNPSLALLNVAANYVLGFAAVYVGRWVAL